METRHPVEIQFGCKFPAICYHCGVMAAWSRQIWNIFETFLCFFLEKRPLMIKFSKFCSESLHRDTDRRCVQKFVKTVRPYVIYLTKKKQTFFRLPLKLWLLRGLRPKSAMASPQHLADKWQLSKFRPNRFTFGGVIAGRVKTVQNAPLSRIRVNPSTRRNI